MNALLAALTKLFEIPAVSAILSICDAGSHVSTIVRKIKSVFADDSIEARMVEALNRALENTCIELGWEYDSMVVSELNDSLKGKTMSIDELSALLKQYVGPAFTADAVNVWIECFDKIVATDQILTNYLSLKYLQARHSNRLSIASDDSKQLTRYPDTYDDGMEKYTFVIKRDEDHVSIDETSKGILKKLCEKYWWKERPEIQVELVIEDYNEISHLLIQEDAEKNNGYGVAAFMADQTLRMNYVEQKRILEIAIEFMLRDQLLDSWAYSFCMMTDEYEKRYGVNNCYYFDENGIQRGYWSYFIWVDIIDELLSKLLTGRSGADDALQSMTPIDCWIETRNGKEVWKFTSFISNNLHDEKAEKMRQALSWRDCDCIDIHPNVRIRNLCPDLYYSIGYLNVKDRKKYREITEQFSNVFCLLYYRFGYK